MAAMTEEGPKHGDVEYLGSGLEYTYIEESRNEIPEGGKYYISRLSRGMYVVIKRVDADDPTEQMVLRFWKAEEKRYINVAWMPDGVDLRGKLLYGLPRTFSTLWDAEANLRKVDEFLALARADRASDGST